MGGDELFWFWWCTLTRVSWHWIFFLVLLVDKKSTALNEGVCVGLSHQHWPRYTVERVDSFFGL